MVSLVVARLNQLNESSTLSTSYLELAAVGPKAEGWLESLQRLPSGGFFIATDVHGPDTGVYYFTEDGKRARLFSADSPSGIGLDKAGGIATLVDVDNHQLRRWKNGEEISPVPLNESGVEYPNDARRDTRTGFTVGGSIGASVSQLGRGGPEVIRKQPLWLVRPDGQVCLSKEVYTCLNGIAFGKPGTVYSVESFGGQRLVSFTFDSHGNVRSERGVYEFLSNPDGICSFQVNGSAFLAVAHPFTNEITILALTGEGRRESARQVFGISSTNEIGQPITPVVEVRGSRVLVTSVVTVPGDPNMFEGSRSGLASVEFDASCLFN